MIRFIWKSSCRFKNVRILLQQVLFGCGNALLSWCAFDCLIHPLLLRPSYLLFMKLVNCCLGGIAFELWSHIAKLNRCRAVPSVGEFLNWISLLLP